MKKIQYLLLLLCFVACSPERKKDSTLAIQIENFLREILPAGKALILCSNMNINEIEEKIKLKSLVNRYLKIIEMEGEDFSEKKNDILDKLLDNKFNYFSKELLKSSEEHFNNDNIYYEKQYYKNLED